MPLHLATSHSAFKGKLQEHKALMQVPLRHAIQVSSQMSVRNDTSSKIYLQHRQRSNKVVVEDWILLIIIFPFGFLDTGKKGMYSRIIWHNRQEQDCTRRRIVHGDSQIDGFKKPTNMVLWRFTPNQCSKIQWHSCPGKSLSIMLGPHTTNLLVFVSNLYIFWSQGILTHMTY